LINLNENQWCWRWGCRDCKRTPKSFDLLKIWEKALKMRVKMASKVKKTYEDLSGGNTKMAKVAQKTFRASLGNNKYHGQSKRYN